MKCDSNEDDLELGFLEKVLKGRDASICPPPLLLSAYAGKRLAPQVRKVVEEHVSRCIDCNDVVEAVLESSLTCSRDHEKAVALKWETIRAQLPLTLPYFHQDTAMSAAARVAAVKAKIAAYTPALAVKKRISMKRFSLPLALAASLVAVFLLVTIILLSTYPNFHYFNLYGGDSRGNIVITASGIKERGSIQITQSPEQSPVTTHPVDPGASKVTVQLDPGVYWVRVLGERSESQWIPVKVELSGKSKVLIQSESNVVLFSPSSPVESLEGSNITYELNGKKCTGTINSPSFELGPLRKDDSLSNVVLHKGSEEVWRYPGIIPVKGGKQVVEVGLKAEPQVDADPEPEIAEKDLINVIDTLEKSTVKIEICLPSGQKGVGTGFAVKHPGGVGIVTGYHVIEGASSIMVSTSAGRTFEAHLRASGKDADLVLLDIPPEISIPPVTFGDSAKLKRGQKVFVLGNPLNEDYSVCDGIVSKLKSTDKGMRVLMLSNKLNPGNSGSPLFLETGEVVGMVSAKLKATAEIDSVGVSLASEEIEKWLGIR